MGEGLGEQPSVEGADAVLQVGQLLGRRLVGTSSSTSHPFPWAASTLARPGRLRFSVSATTR